TSLRDRCRSEQPEPVAGVGGDDVLHAVEAEELTERRDLVLLAVDEERALRRMRELPRVGEEALAVRVAREPLDRGDLGTEVDLVAVDPHVARAVDDAPP